MTTPAGPEQQQRKGWIDMNMLLSMHLPAIAIGFGLGATVVVIPELSKESFDATLVMVISVFVFQQLGQAVAPIPTGYLIDKIGRRKMLLAGPFVIAASSLLIVMSIVMDGSFNEILIYRFFGGIGEQMWLLSRITVIADTGGSQQRGKQITSMFGVQQIGNLSGPIAGGALSVAFGFWVPFALHAFIVVAAVIPSFYVVKETMHRPGAAAVAAGPRAAGSVERSPLTKKDLLTPPIPQVFAAQFLANVTRGGIFGGGVIVTYASFAFDMGELEIGFLRSTMAFVGIPIVFGAGFIMDKYGRKYTIVPGLMLSGIAMFFLAATDAFDVGVSVFISAFILVHLAVSLISGNMQTLGTDVAPPHARGSFFGVSRQIAQAGSLLSPVSFGLLQALSYTVAFTFLGGAAVLASLVVLLGVPETLKKEVKAEKQPEKSGS
ncbi:MAG: MFS transporter [Chloroflexi bacterium]|nr:MFS transporter [Chloroflexota bacterium]